MPRKALFTKEHITEKAISLVRNEGIEALTARELGKILGSSSRPIFTVFRNMDEVEAEVHTAARKMFSDYVSDVTDYHPAFKELGLRTIRFAREEKHLFHYLFLSKEADPETLHSLAKECLGEICMEFGITKRQSEKLFRQMWTFTCGLALMSTKDIDNCSDKIVGEMLSFQFMATLDLIKSGKRIANITPHIRKKGESDTNRRKHRKTLIGKPKH